VKQYLIAKMVDGLRSQGIELVPLPGLYSLGAAEDLVAKALVSEPGSKYMIQEVGAA
jgi:hypothetical protein